MNIVPPVRTFTAIDFETATGYRNSICQTGVVRVVDGRITDEQSWLNQPPGNEYWWKYTAIHGISATTTATQPHFDGVWSLLRPYITGQDVVAHNSAFDFTCLQATLLLYGLSVPYYRGHCTLRLMRGNPEVRCDSYGLGALCAKYGIALQHHDALSDARACVSRYAFFCVQKSIRGFLYDALRVALLFFARLWRAWHATPLKSGTSVCHGY